jgi:creatinine amidohydrolase/Fe(II)-dependent formamide hydrolase-like protein
MMLHIAGDLVHPDRARVVPAPPAVAPAAVTETVPTEYISDLGNSGDPTRASAAKGRHLVDRAVTTLVALLDAYADCRLATPRG